MNRLIWALALLCQVAGAAEFVTGMQGNAPGDRDEAFREWRSLARRGNAGAQFNLALMYARGEGVAQDHSEAVAWYRLAAEQGHAKAQLNLGYMYNGGHGVLKNSLEAMKWFHMAAAQGHAIAQANLGRQFYTGDGVPEDHVRSWAWFDLAAAQGDEEARRNRDIIIKVMTSAQIAEAQNLSRELCAKIPNCVN